MSPVAPEVIQRRYQKALLSLVEKLEKDRTVLAAILFGSLSYDEVWENSDIDLWIIMQDGEKRGHVTLCEDDVNIQAQRIPRRSARGSWACCTYSMSPASVCTRKTTPR